MSSLGTAGTLADPALRLPGSSGGPGGANADSGAGFDAVLSFTPASRGNYSLQLSGTGSVTGAYASRRRSSAARPCRLATAIR